MASNNKVTLVFAGDSSALDKTYKDVAAGSHQVETASNDVAHGLKDVGSQAKASKTLLKGAGEAAQLFGGELGNTAMQASAALSVLKDLSKGSGALVAQFGLLRIGMVGVAVAAAALAIEGTKNQQGWANLGQDVWKPLASQLSIADGVVQKMPGHLGFLGSALDGVTNSARVHAGMSETDAAAMRDQEAAAKNTAAALAALHEQMLFQQPDQNPGGDAFVTALDMQNINLAATSFDQSSDVVAKAVHTGGAKIAKAVDTEAQKLKDRLSKWQDIADGFSTTAKNIAESLGPKLQQADQGLILFKGPSLLDKLKKQLTDTLHLQKDLKALAKGGLSADLLTQLTNGGLDSLGAADEILGGGKKGIGAVNKVAGQITAAGGSIAGAEAAREIKNQDKTIKVEVDVKGAQKEFESMLAKIFATKGAKSFGLKAA